MTYIEALDYRNKHLSLINTSDDKGFTIGEILILPIDEFEQKAFFGSYLISWDQDAAILPFKESDVQVWAVDIQYLRKAQVLFYDVLAK